MKKAILVRSVFGIGLGVSLVMLLYWFGPLKWGFVNQAQAAAGVPTTTAITIDFNDNVKTIAIEFDEEVKTTGSATNNFDLTKVLVRDTVGGADLIDLSANDITETASSTTVTITLTEAQRVTLLQSSGVTGGDAGKLVVIIEAEAAYSGATDEANISGSPIVAGNITETADTNAPSVSAFVTTSGATTGVSATETIKATFSETMTTASVTISTSPNLGVSWTAAWSGSDLIVTFTPVGNLPSDTTLTVTITAGEDLGENDIASESSVVFTTRAGGGGGGASSAPAPSPDPEPSTEPEEEESDETPAVVPEEEEPAPVSEPEVQNPPADGHPNGTLILDTDGTIYLIVNGVKKGFRTPEEYMSHGYKFSQAVPANDTDRSLSSASEIVKALDGTLVLDKSDNQTIYMIAGGMKRGFVSAEVFLGLGYSFAGAVLIDLSDYPAGDPIVSMDEAHPNGALVSDSAGTIWWILEGQRRGFQSPQIFFTYGFSFDKVVYANAADLALPEGDLVKFRDGTIVYDQAVHYLISNGMKRRFASPEVMAGWGYSQANAISASLAGYEEGAVIE